jgi:hypothetical protein
VQRVRTRRTSSYPVFIYFIGNYDYILYYI